MNIKFLSLKLKSGRIDFMHSMRQAVKQQEHLHKELQKVCYEQWTYLLIVINARVSIFKVYVRLSAHCWLWNMQCHNMMLRTAVQLHLKNVGKPLCNCFLLKVQNVSPRKTRTAFRQGWCGMYILSVVTFNGFLIDSTSLAPCSYRNLCWAYCYVLIIHNGCEMSLELKIFNPSSLFGIHGPLMKDSKLQSAMPPQSHKLPFSP